MMNTANDLIYLVSCTVRQQAPDPQRCAGMKLREVFELAMRHSLTIAAALALEQALPLPDYFAEEQYKAMRRLWTFGIEWSQIQSALEQRGIWYMPLKGIVLKDYYQPAEIREMSDNDILIDPEKADEVRELMENAGYKCVLFGGNHHDVYSKGVFLDFEMHRLLFEKHAFPQFYAYYSGIRQKMIKDGENAVGYHLSAEDFYIFLICHLYKHYQTCGTGLRSLLDIFVFHQKTRGKLNAAYVDRELQKLELLSFERDVKCFAEKLFTLQPLNEAEQNELEFYVSSNSHGTKENLLAKKLGNTDSAAAKRRYALSRIFPSQESLERHHPFVSRHKALYPLLVAYRPVKGLLKHRKLMKSEISGLKKFKKKNNGKFNS